MKTILSDRCLVLNPENSEEADVLTYWRSETADQVLVFDQNPEEGFAIKVLGYRVDVCREPINVTSKHPDEAIRTIGNFANTPFVLDGQYYQSVESFWQGLKVTDLTERRRVAMLSGAEAKSDSSIPSYNATFQYEGATVAVGTWHHWQLMKRACEAKFQQNNYAKDALLSTGNRPLVHEVQNDSKVIPGVIMADIWMSIRKMVSM
jgi:predicted NAD-dependent protein-ADP-ribosyltransferase YbiA (DUF1768 family)